VINVPIFGATSPASFRDAIVAAKPDPKTGKPDPETITQATPQQKGTACEPINFDPLVMADGIAPTNDPILLFRSPAYAVSFGERLHLAPLDVRIVTC
jgi:catalase